MSGSQLALLGGPFGAGAAGDPNWQNVALLSGTTTTNAGQNNTFIDSSSNAFTITRNGNTTQGTFSPFSQADGYWSNYFDGSGDYIVSSTNTGLNLTTGDFTVEFWVYATTLTSGMEPVQLGDGTNGWSPLFGYLSGSTLQLYLSSSGSSWDVASGQSMGTLEGNIWIHYAVTRSGSTFRTFKNGTLVSSFTSSATLYQSSNQISVGNGQATHYWFGYISNVRVVKGTALYTANFTPSTTPLTAVSGTSFLSCQSNRFIDNSASPLTITVNGNPAVISFQPFGAPIVPYSASTIGGSGYFDGSGDYLTFSERSLTGDFTLEGWFYPTHTSGTKSQCLFGGSTTNTQNNIDEYNYGGIGYYNNGARFDLAGTNFYHFCWNHFAYVRSGSTVKLWINGKDSGGSCTDNGTFYLSAVLGNTTYGLSYLGYSSIRVSNSARYTTAFTPPTSPWTSDANTVLLLNCTNANIYDAAAKNDMETAGNAQVSTSVKKYGDSSMVFDGNGDYLAMPNSPLYDMRAGEFTIEGWMYQTNSSVDQTICAKYEPSYQGSWYIGTTSTANWGVYFYYGASSNLVVYTGAAPSLNTWHHFALVRCSDRVLFYVDGNQLANVAAQTMRTTTSGLSIGRTGEGYTEYFYGYLSDIRITTGVGRYPYNFTPPTTSLPNFYQAQTLTADPYFEYTTLLLPGSGTNGAQNNTFLDSSSNTFSITRNGNTTQGTFSPFSQTGWSNYFEGTTNYLTTPSSSQFAMGDFTVECFINWGETPNIAPIIDIGGYISGLSLRAGPTTLFAYLFNTSYSSNTISWTVNSWNHIALVRSGSTLYWYLNGTRVGTTSAVSTTLPTAQTAISGILAGGIVGLNRYMSNIRVVNTALYTGTTLTVPTAPLTAVSGTVLLTCQNNRFVDNSTNAFALTVNGTPSVQAFSPFNPTAAYSAATNGGSGYFDGTGDYLSTANSSSFAFGTGDFTIECWVYLTGGTSNDFADVDGGSTGYWLWNIYSGTMYWQSARAATNLISVALSNYQNQWVHFAVVRNSGTTKIYQNGIQIGSASDSTNYNGTAGNLRVGYAGITALTGYISNFRIVKGTAVYTSNFTPPTAPLAAITNTSLLCNFTNAGITDATAKNDLETVGNAQISNTIAKWGSTSMYFDGAGDYLISPNSQNLILGTGDFTVEAWVYPTTANYQTIVCLGRYLYNVGVLRIQDDNTVRWYFNDNSVGVTTTNKINLNAWNHICASRYGGTTKVFINGVQGGSFSDSSNYNSTYATVIAGEDQGSSPANLLTGYLQDVRITKGIARYTQNFTPPTAAFQLL